MAAAQWSDGVRSTLVWDRANPITRRQFTRTALRLGFGAAAAPALMEALAACASSNKKTLTWSRGDDLRTQDPQQISGLMEGTIARMLYDPLLDTDAKGYQVNALATSGGMDPGGTTYTFKLQSGVKFQDGSDFDASAVVFTYNRLLENSTFQHASSFKGVLTKVEAVDPMTVRFTLAKPNPGLITSFGEPILGPAAAKKYGADFYKYGIGTGPVLYQSWTPNQQWIGTGNTNYWVKGLVKVNQFVFRSIPEDATREAALQNGEVDIIDSLSGDEAAQLAKNSNVSIVRSPSTNEIAITFNVKRDPFSNKNARWAVAYAIDKQNIVQNIVKEGATVGASIPPGTVGYDDNLFKTVIPYDMNKARSYLAQAGIKPGTTISFKLNPAWFANLNNTAQYITNQLQQLGFKVNMQFLEPGAYTQARQSGDFDLCIQEIGRANNPDPNFTIIYVDSAFGNFYKDINPNIVPMIEQARTELDAQKRNADYQQIQQVLANDLPELILYQEEFIWGVRKRVTGFVGRTDEATRVYGCDVTS